MRHEPISQDQLVVLRQLHRAHGATAPRVEMDDLMALGQSGLLHFDPDGHTCLTDAGIKLIGEAGTGAPGSRRS